MSNGSSGDNCTSDPAAPQDSEEAQPGILQHCVSSEASFLSDVSEHVATAVRPIIRNIDVPLIHVVLCPCTLTCVEENTAAPITNGRSGKRGRNINQKAGRAAINMSINVNTGASINKREVSTKHKTPLCGTWLRLLLVAFLAVFVAGLVPGQALFIRMLADYGIFKSLCEEGEHTCMKQELSVTAAFNIIQGISFFSHLPAGYMFDRLGGRWTSCIGAACTFAGVLAMEIPILGVSYGYDSFTSRVFPFAICLVDVGNVLSQYCILSLVYHFPNSQMLLLALIIAQQQMCASLPNVFLYVQQEYQLDLSEVFALFSILTLCALIGLAASVPSQKAYLKQASRVLGTALPAKSRGFWSDIKVCCRAMRVHRLDHVYFCVALTCVFTQAIMYPSIVGQYAELLWGSQKAGDDFAALLTLLMSTVGTSVTIIVSIGADWVGPNAIYVFAGLSISLLMCSSLTLLGTTYFQQLICMLCNIILTCLTIPLAMKYCVAYTPPSQVGTFNGVVWTIVVFGYTTEMTFFLRLAVNATTAADIGTVLLMVNYIALITFIIWATRQFVKGLPRRPPLTPRIPRINESEDLTESFLS